MALLYDIILLQFLGLITVKICQFIKYRLQFIDQIFGFFLGAAIYLRELCHFAVSKILFVPIEWSDLNFDEKQGRRNIEYALTPDYYKRISFLKEGLIATAPIWIGTYLSYKLYDWYKISDWIVFRILIISGFIIILCFTRPTLADYGGIFKVIIERPLNFIKQLIFLGVSYLIYIYNFDYFNNLIPHYHYFYEFLLLLSLEGLMELIFILTCFIIKILGSRSRNNSMLTRRAERKWRRESSRQMFPSRRERKKEKASMDDLYSGFSLLPYDDETAAEEFQEAMIRENKLMIDIRNKAID
jgi:hypothetical protein